MAGPEQDVELAPAAGEAATVGMLLRQLREHRGLTQEAVSLETRIPVASIRKIEENRFAELPGEVFVRGFLRAYARALGADPARVMEVYDLQQGPREPVKTSRWPGLFHMPRPRRVGLFVAFVVFVVILALLFAFVYRGVGNDSSTPAPAPQARRLDAGAADVADTP